MRVLEERCVWVALGKEGSCSLTAEHHSTPRDLASAGQQACSRSWGSKELWKQACNLLATVALEGFCLGVLN